MLYAWDIVVTAGTADKTPVEQSLPLTYGVLRRIKVKYPPGCHGLVKVKVLRLRDQLFPLNPDSWATGDAEEVSGEYDEDLTDAPYTLTFQGSAPQTSYNHTVTVRVEVLRRREDPIVTILRRLLGL